MKTTDKQINLKKTYLYASILYVVGLVIYAVWFLDLMLYFSIAGAITIMNYYLLERIQRYKDFNQTTVFGTLFIRYIIYVVVAFIVIWLNRTSPKIELIGISLVIGFSLVQIATIINTLTSKSEVGT